MDFNVAIKKPFTNFKKFLIGSLLSILPIVNFFALGFGYECSGVGKNKKSDKMPEWSNWGEYFVKGLLGAIIGFVYFIPAIIVFIFAAGTILTGLLASFGGVALSGVVSAEGQVINAFVEQNWGQLLPMLATIAPMLLLVVIFGLIASYLMPIGILNYIKSGQVADAFKFSDVLKKAFTGKYFVVWIVVFVISAIVNALLGNIPVLGPAVGSFVLVVFSFTLFGEVYRELK